MCRIGDQLETDPCEEYRQMRELLVPEAEVILEKSDNPARKTKYESDQCEQGGPLDQYGFPGPK